LLGIAFGNRPSFTRDRPDRVPTPHPLRTSRAELDKLLARLVDGTTRTAICHVSVPATIASPAGAGTDVNYVTALLGGARFGGVESPRELICATLSQDKALQMVAVDSGFRRRIVSNPLPAGPFVHRMSSDTHGTVIHELSHAFNLQDEYSEFKRSLPAGRNDLLNQGNVMTETELKAAAGKLDGSKLRWRWPRIQRAAVLTHEPTKKSGSDFVVALRKGQSARFAVGDTVFLRQRPLLRLPKPGDPQVVTSGKLSDALTVLDVRAGADQLVVHAPVSFVAKDFPAVLPN